MILDEDILKSLYDYFSRYPGARAMPLQELCQELFGSQEILDLQKQQLTRNLRNMEKQDMVGCSLLMSGNAGTVWLTNTGNIIAEQLKNTRPCPASLDDLAQNEQDLAKVIKRETIFNQIRATLKYEDTHIIILFGQPMVGKSSLLSRISKELANEYIPIKITFEMSCFRSLDAFTLNLVEQFRIALGKFTGGENLPSLTLPKRDDFVDGMGEKVFFKWWEEFLGKTSNKQPLVMFEEIEQLVDKHEMLAPGILPFLEKLLHHTDNAFFILTGSDKIKESEIKAFNNLVEKGFPILVPYYDETVPKLAFAALKEHLIFEDGTMEQYLALCDGHPCLLRILYMVIISHISEKPGKKTIGKDDLEEIANKMLQLTKDRFIRIARPLSSNERYLIGLMSQSTITLTEKTIYSVDDLFILAQQKSKMPIDLKDFDKGVHALQDRGWIVLETKQLIRFKMSIFLFWLSRYQIDIMELCQ
jgi:AAA+ ATPase superfamily predicted ATPase